VVSSSLQYLPGICLVFTAIVWCVQAILPNHVQSYMSLRVIGLRVRAAVQVSNLSTLWVFCDLKWVDHWNKKSNGIVVLALSEELPLRFLCGSHIFCGVLFCLKGYLRSMLFLCQCRPNYHFLKSQDVTQKLWEHCCFCDALYDQTRQLLHQKIGEHFRPRFLMRYF